MRRWSALLLLMLVTFIPVQAFADKAPSLTSSLSSVAYPGPPLSSGSTSASLLLKIQGYECKYCRRQCVEDFKIECYESERWCRRQFVRCMRECWEQICR